MRIEKLQLSTAKFATIDGNREIDTKRLMKVIKKDGQVLVPILVVKYQDVKDECICIHDLRTGECLVNPSDDYYLIVDGQHRSKCALQLFEEMQKGDVDVKISDFIYANVYEIEDIMDQDIMALIMSINSSAKSWASRDYIKCAFMHKPEDEVLIVIDLLSKLGFSISNISRYLYNDHKKLKPEHLSKHISGEENLKVGHSRKTLEILRMLIETGFDINFLKKRYLAVEFVSKRNDDQLEDFLNSLFRLDSVTVEKIEKLTPQDLDSHIILEIVQEYDSNLSKVKLDKCFKPNLSEERLNENLSWFKALLERRKTEKRKKSIEEYSVDDVK